jgi:uncharacterized coiled-coil DUF342 family protein
MIGRRLIMADTNQNENYSECQECKHLEKQVERLRSALTEIEDAGLHYQKSPYLSSLLVKIEALTKERDELKKWGEEHKEGYIEVREQLADTLKEITELKQKLMEGRK